MLPATTVDRSSTGSARRPSPVWAELDPDPDAGDLRQEVRAHRRPGRRRRPGRTRRGLAPPPAPGAGDPASTTSRSSAARCSPARGEQIDGRPRPGLGRRRARELAAAAEVTVLTRTTAFGSLRRQLRAGGRAPDGPPRRAAAGDGVSRQRLWHIRARQVVLATGAHERPLVFAGNDRPGVMLAGAVRTYLNRYAVAAGRAGASSRTTNDSAYDSRRRLRAPVSRWSAVVDARAEPSRGAGRAESAGVRVITGSTVVDTDRDGPRHRRRCRRIDADGLAVGEPRDDRLRPAGGLRRMEPGRAPAQPTAGRLRWDDALAAFVPTARSPTSRSSARPRGRSTLAGVSARGLRCRRPGRAPGRVPGRARGPGAVARSADGVTATTRPLWLVPGLDGEPGELDEHFVDLQRDQTVADVLAGHRRRHAQRRARQALHLDRHRQRPGQDLGVNAIGVIAAALGDAAAPAEIGTTTYRAPYTPVPFAALAGRERGDLFDPERTTPAHAWHVAHGAEFEIVGQWLRPVVLPAAGRGHGRRGRPRVPRRARGRRDDGRLHPRQDRDPRRATPVSSSTGSTPTASRSSPSARRATA